jgi:hypothetical protein
MPGGAVRQPDMRASAIDLQQMLRPVASMRTGVFQLPPDIDDFTGREDDLRAVQSGLEPATDHVDVIVSAIAGRAGVGKTALATKLAHQLQPRFPDGQLYVNLRGSEVERLAPADVLGEFLLELGVARAAIPERIEQRASRYRAQLAKQRVLVVLDNAADEAQVRPPAPTQPQLGRPHHQSCPARQVARRTFDHARRPGPRPGGGAAGQSGG